KTDPDKRALFLAGNRRGNTVPVKEKDAPDGRWKTRYVNTFCPRAFSAIGLPDATLGSRTIVVPLVRTGDPSRGNADVMDYRIWPNDRRQLIDDLWALGLAHLPDLARYDAALSQESTLVGRNLEPWRAILAVASFLDDKGVPGLRERMESLARNYQIERIDLQ